MSPAENGALEEARRRREAEEDADVDRYVENALLGLENLPAPRVNQAGGGVRVIRSSRNLS